MELTEVINLRYHVEAKVGFSSFSESDPYYKFERVALENQINIFQVCLDEVAVL
jgi:hypothetical protein